MDHKQTLHRQNVTRQFAADMRAALLAWYDRHRRLLPWRATPGRLPAPYHVWLSEIMLQQTTVVTVGPYFERFLDRWPSIHELAAADLDEVMHSWQGLGYYARARNLHRCARIISRDHCGRFPDTEDALKSLPGIGPYTAAAIAAIAFDRPANVVDGNIERVIARLFAIQKPLPAGKTILRNAAALLAPTKGNQRSGDYAQALMDLGATICTVRKPICSQCPWVASCAATTQGIADSLPRRAPKVKTPTRNGVAFWVVRSDGAILLRRRPEMGLLGGMMEVPSTDWRNEGWSDAAAVRVAPVKADWVRLPGQVRHAFTHFHLTLKILSTHVDDVPFEGVWCQPDKFNEYALPTLMKKIVIHVFKAG